MCRRSERLHEWLLRQGSRESGLVLRFVDNEVLVLILLCDADHLSGRFDEMCLGSVSSVGAICSPHYQST